MKHRNIYLAGRYSRRKELANYAQQIMDLKLGHKITANWLRGNEVGQTWEENAIMDLEDVLRADLVISFTEPYGSKNFGGGRHVEFGLAYAKNIENWIVGELEVIFHYLPNVKHFSSFESVLTRLSK